MIKKTIAMYLRSSVEQNAEKRNCNNPDESDTIANQRRFLKQYLENKNFSDYEIKEYVDDGHTGTDFDRPAFKKLIEDAKTGLIHVIIVKDFSRMGRDYIGVGDYMEQFFPRMGIRVISVNDHWDSAEHVGETLELDASFRTLIYDMYSRDLSKKRKSANAVRNKNGTYTYLHAPYGYQKSEDGSTLIINEETAAVVRNIFELFVSGMSGRNIAKSLNEKGIMTPLKLTELNGRKENTTLTNKDYWKSQGVMTILRNEVYTGVMITNRYDKAYHGNYSKLRDRSEWYFFQDRHEAIISKEMFEKVQRMLPKKRCDSAYTEDKKSYPIYCGHCGAHFTRTTRMEDIFMCRDGMQIPGAVCGEIQIRRDVFEKTIIEMINMEAKLLLDWVDMEESRASDTKEIDKQIRKLEKQKENYRKKRIELYEKYREGSLDRDAFIEQKLHYLQQEEDCMAELENLDNILYEHQAKLKKLDESKNDLTEGVYLESYESEIVDRLIEKVEVFNDERIKIYWRFENEFPECKEPKEKNKLDDEVNGNAIKKNVAIYTADLRYEEMQDYKDNQSAVILDYCRNQLHLRSDDISEFHDSCDSDELFYMADYMKMLNRARNGEFKYIVINSFADLYLTKNDLYNLLYWVLPKLPCSFISVQDGYDSLKVEVENNAELKEQVYKKHNSVRRTDIMKQRWTEIKSGEREPKKRKATVCVKTYGYYSSEKGFIGDEEILNVVAEIYKQALAGEKLFRIARDLNQKNIPTPNRYWREHGYNLSEEKNKKWSGEKVWQILRNEKYAGRCKYKEVCQEKSVYCELKHLVSDEEYQYVSENCQYRKGRW